MNQKHAINPWIEMSIEYARQRSYLDDLFQVYPTNPDGIRVVNNDIWHDVELAFNARDNVALLRSLLRLNLFPIKDSYVAYLKRDKKAMERNPQTVNRLAGRLYEMGLDELYKRASEPKETNRQIGPLFKRWIRNKSLGIDPVPLDIFASSTDNAILDATDAEMTAFAREHLNYQHSKGLDLVARFNGRYVIGEAKFLTDFGGHQNAQFNDAISTVQAYGVRAITVAILDGVLYIEGKNKMYRDIVGRYAEENIMSALLLRDFLYSL